MIVYSCNVLSDHQVRTAARTALLLPKTQGLHEGYCRWEWRLRAQRETARGNARGQFKISDPVATTGTDHALRAVCRAGRFWRAQFSSSFFNSA